jgi:hypothetical protein
MISNAPDPGRLRGPFPGPPTLVDTLDLSSDGAFGPVEDVQCDRYGTAGGTAHSVGPRRGPIKRQIKPGDATGEWIHNRGYSEHLIDARRQAPIAKLGRLEANK